MVERKQYLEKMIKLKDKQIIKAITGVRCCGKSTLLKQFQNYLRVQGVQDKQIIALDFEKAEYKPLLEYHALYNYVKEQLLLNEQNYVFLDEIQLVPCFQKVVSSLFVEKNVDIYITSSNAHMLSGKLHTLLSGRYIEIHMLPLSFAEYHELSGGDKREDWNAYFKNGGFPYSVSIEDEDIRKDYLQEIYQNISNIVSPKKITNILTSYGRKTTSATVENYIQALEESFVLYKIKQYDVKKKQYLKFPEKYYLVDQGLRGLLLENRNADIGRILENIVYLELIRRGYQVSIGKIGNLEVDFIAEKNGDKTYFQVSASVLDSETFQREITPLKKIADHYPKYIVTMDELAMDEDGIKQKNIVDFLLEEK